MKSIIKQAITGDPEVFDRIKPHMVPVPFNIIYTAIYNVHKAGKVSEDAVIEALNKPKSQPKQVEQLKNILKSGDYYVQEHLSIAENEYGKRLLDDAIEKLQAVGKHFTLSEAEIALKTASQQITDMRQEDDFQSDDEILENHFERIETNTLENKLMIDKAHWALQSIFGSYISPRMYVIGGNPSMAKNFLGDNLAVELSKSYQGIYWSLDNSISETSLSLTAIRSGVKYNNLYEGIVTTEEKIRIARLKYEKVFITSKEKKGYELYGCIDKMFRSGYKPRWIIFDYLQLMPIDSSGNPAYEYAQLSKYIKRLCIAFDMAVIVYSQAIPPDDKKKYANNTSQEDVPPKQYHRFRLEDTQWTKALGQDAYFVCGMEGYREDNEKYVNVVKDKRHGLRRQLIKYKPETGQLV
uniref:Putative helicase n=1 Tax=viral metagenome TaxID=1070528 RepID=A0A6M3MIQ0_9ZZZZ